jgi:hypothetical protein
MANLYTIQDLLIGKVYRSNSTEGTIVSAEKSDAWFGRYDQAYLVEIDKGTLNNTYRTIAVRAEDNSERFFG